MTFAYVAALAVALLVAAPFVAHLLQRRRADERAFPPARLVAPSPPVARRRRHIDDRALYAVRTAAVLALALLGATPFVRCSSLALGRQGGASLALAIVLDDSLSMLAEVEQKTRWDRALRAADELVDGAREGDAIGVVLAGSPPRIALAPTTDLAAARSVVRSLSPSHRATDLEGALELAHSIVHGLPQPDRRVVLLSDLSDGHSDGPPLGESREIPLWIPLTDLAKPAPNCAVLRADRQRDRATVRVGCFPADAGRQRSIEVYAGDHVVGRTPLPDEAGAIDVGVELTGASGDLMARVTGKDAIRADDAAPVLATTGGLSIAIVADPAGAKLVTGGAPPVEQALAALALDVRLRPLPLVPDRLEDLAGFAGVVIEDPPGFTPEARRSLTAWVDRGGVVLLALGPHAPLAPLGANFEPLVPGSIGWGPSPAPGLDDKASVLFGSAAAGLVDFRPRGRATIDPSLLGSAAQVTARWKDGAPWLIERPVGRGYVFVLTVPTSPDESDLALRPAFLMLLDRVVDATRTRNGAYRITVGEAWTFEGAKSLQVVGPEKNKLPITDEPTRKVVVPDRIGTYELGLDGDKLTRVVAASEKEVDQRPRRVSPDTRASSLGDTRAKIDLSPYLAIGLLALLVGELALRLRARRASSVDAERAAPVA
ncbi:MAG TPA: VWA domain-containing protein [Polyangiaceae bacterium]|nr:VWA domain-containing protein [Polyangiaceae bacterium]